MLKSLQFGFCLWIVFLFITGCDSTEKEKVYYSEMKTASKSQLKESKEVPIVKSEVDKSNLLTEGECLIIAKRHMVEYLTEVGKKPDEKRILKEEKLSDRLYLYVDGNYTYVDNEMGIIEIDKEPFYECRFAFRGGKSGEDFNIITIDPLAGSIIGMQGFAYPQTP